MVDGAITVLSRGWHGMSSTEREQFQRFFDPANTGDIDAQFLSQVLDNYRQIREQFDKELTFEFEAESQMCDLMRLYYTDLFKIHVCPYFATETRTDRLARQLVHEMTHIALLVVDRPYYYPTSSAYATLTPRGPWTAQIPVIGPLFRELAHSDTLYHPDAYARFAAELVAEPEGEPRPSPEPCSSPSVDQVVDMAVLRQERFVASLDD
jgi:hypothetical protein